MNIAGVGTDIVSKSRIKQVLNNHGDKFLKRLLTSNELKQVPEGRQQKIDFVSKRWAAKEAISKVFGTGIGKQLSFKDIEISHCKSGAPIVVLSERSQKLAREKNFSDVKLSISDEKKYAIAFAISSEIS